MLKIPGGGPQKRAGKVSAGHLGGGVKKDQNAFDSPFGALPFPKNLFGLFLTFLPGKTKVALQG